MKKDNAIPLLLTRRSYIKRINFLKESLLMKWYDTPAEKQKLELKLKVMYAKLSDIDNKIKECNENE